MPFTIRRPYYEESPNNLQQQFQEDAFNIEDARRAREEGPGRFAEPRIRRPVEDVNQLRGHFDPEGSAPTQVANRPDEDVAQGIIDAATQLAQEGWEPTKWRLPPLPSQAEGREGGEVPTLQGGPRVQMEPGGLGQATSPTTGQQFRVQALPQPGPVEALGSAAVLNVPLAATGAAMGAWEAATQAFPELVDLIAGGVDPSDPEVVRRAFDVAGLVSGGSFGIRAAKGPIGAADDTLGMGAARDVEAPAAPPRELDQAGFYSQALETAQALPRRAQAGQILSAIEKRHGGAAEVRALNLDTALLGEELAGQRRLMLDTKDRLSQVEGGLRELERSGQPIPPEALQARDAIRTELASLTQEVDRGIRTSGATFERTAILNHIRENRPQVRETVYDPPQYREGSAGPGIDIPLNAGRTTRYDQWQLDKDNPTNREIVLHIQPKGQGTIVKLRRLWDGMSRDNAETLRAAWGVPDKVIRREIGDEYADHIAKLREKHKVRLAAIKQYTKDKGIYQEPHFTEPNVIANAMTSLHRLPDGSTTLAANQFQSHWATKSKKDPDIAKHPLVEDLDAWLRPTLRRVVKDAVDRGATSVAVPDGATVNSYNPGMPDKAMAMYDRIAPKRMQEVLREIDPEYKTGPDTVDRLLPETEGRVVSERMRGYEPDEIGFNEVTENQGRWRVFKLSPAIIEHYQSGGGSQLFQGGNPTVGLATSATMSRRKGLMHRLRELQPEYPGSRTFPAAEPIEWIGPNDPHPGPVIAFHSTDANFPRFDLEYTADIGHHFGTREQANRRAAVTLEWRYDENENVIPTEGDVYGGSGYMSDSRVIPAYLNIRNPIDMTDPSHWRPLPMAEEIAQMLPDETIAVNLPRRVQQARHRGERGQFDVIRDTLSELGFDSIRYRNGFEGPGWSYIVWEPNTVRSATNPDHTLYTAPSASPKEDKDGKEKMDARRRRSDTQRGGEVRP